MNIFDFSVKDTKNNEVSLSEHQGKVLLVVNTAVECGLTPQYAGIEALYEKYKDQGFEVLDFPCNQFLNQAPGSMDEINEFCTMNFGASFPRYHKIDVNGENTEPLFTWLKEQAPEVSDLEIAAAFNERVAEFTPGIAPSDIHWNFGKFLVGRDGQVIARFSPAFEPAMLEEHIEKAL